jgi:hypothetical protein
LRGEHFGLRMNLNGEGKFKAFQSPNEIPELKQYLDGARARQAYDITLRFAGIDDGVISEY